jgi:hypothetical protein
LGDVELHVLAVPQFAEALTGDVGVVGGDVRAAALLRDEAEALLRVEPLHSALGHARLLRGGSGPYGAAGPEVIALVRKGLYSKEPAGEVTAGQRLRNHDCSVDYANPSAGAPPGRTPPALSCAGAGTAATPFCRPACRQVGLPGLAGAVPTQSRNARPDVEPPGSRCTPLPSRTRSALPAGRRVGRCDVGCDRADAGVDVGVMNSFDEHTAAAHRVLATAA